MDAGTHIIKMQKARSQASFFISWIQEVCLRTQSLHLSLELQSVPTSFSHNSFQAHWHLWDHTLTVPNLTERSFFEKIPKKNSDCSNLGHMCPPTIKRVPLDHVEWGRRRCLRIRRVLLTDVSGKGYRTVKNHRVHSTWVNAKGIIRICKLDKVISVWRAGWTKRIE